MSLMEKISVSDKLHLGLSYRVVGCEFNANKLGWYQLVSESVVTTCSQEPTPVPPPGAMVQYLLIQCLRHLYRK